MDEYDALAWVLKRLKIELGCIPHTGTGSRQWKDENAAKREEYIRVIDRLELRQAEIIHAEM